MVQHFLRNCILVSLTTALALPPCALATNTHWAQPQLLRAQQDRYLAGDQTGNLRPDDALTTAQLATILCRVLDAQTTAPVNVDISAWYYQEVAQARHLQLVDRNVNFDAAITRKEAFCMVAEAFQLTSPTEDLSQLSLFSDTAGLTAEEQTYIASLLNQQYIQGFGGSLELTNSLTRAEFITLLYRILDSGMVSTSENVYHFAGDNLWLSCGTHDINLQNVTADRVVIRSQDLHSLTLSDCDIDNLVLAGDGDIALDLPLQTITVGTGSGVISLESDLDRLQITDVARHVHMLADVQTLTVSGQDNTLTLGGYSTVDTLHLTGAGHTVTVQGEVIKADVLGRNITLLGDGSVQTLNQYAPDCTVDVAVTDHFDAMDYGLTDVAVHLQAPQLLSAETALTVHAKLPDLVTSLENCTATWTIDGKPVKQQTLTLSPNTALSLDHTYTYTKDMPLQSNIGLTLQYTTTYGESTTTQGSAVVQLENHPPIYYEALDKEAILAKVTNQYLGDFTLAWAQTHDYTPAEKEAWITAKGYTSATPYLIWVNEAYQRCNVFDMTTGKPVLLHEFMVACGKGNNTPSVVTVTTTKQVGWYTDSYVCKPIVRFLPNSGFAFHSRLYYPSGNGIKDATIGMPASAGCIRMLEDDIQYLYDTIPAGTRVITF